MQAEPERLPSEMSTGEVDHWFSNIEIPPRTKAPFRIALITVVLGPLPETIDYFLKTAAKAARDSMFHLKNGIIRS